MSNWQEAAPFMNLEDGPMSETSVAVELDGISGRFQADRAETIGLQMPSGDEAYGPAYCAWGCKSDAVWIDFQMPWLYACQHCGRNMSDCLSSKAGAESVGCRHGHSASERYRRKNGKAACYACDREAKREKRAFLAG